MKGLKSFLVKFLFDVMLLNISAYLPLRTNAQGNINTSTDLLYYISIEEGV